MYAIVRDRGAQYRVEEGQLLDVAQMNLDPGTVVLLDEVLMVGGDEPRIGAPLVEGARVRAEVVGEARGEKIVVFK
ncbi:MAG: 50S ribosomal protein L21, partial [Pyrinomonadaceae bacterium]|nr:50S ribosomal protein L21 [Pyrinomonadaceae bacterium]